MPNPNTKNTKVLMFANPNTVTNQRTSPSFYPLSFALSRVRINDLQTFTPYDLGFDGSAKREVLFNIFNSEVNSSWLV